MQSLEVVFLEGFISPIDIIAEIMDLNLFLKESIKLGTSDKDISWYSLKKKSFPKGYFVIDFRGGKVTFSNVLSNSTRYASLIFRDNLKRSELENLANKLSEKTYFVQANAYDSNYSYWQNVYDPRSYEDHGKSLKDKKLISNGLPFPLEKSVIDTSLNIGREVRKWHHIEYVTHLSWLSPKFFEYTGCTAEQILSAEFLKEVTQLDSGVLRVKAFDHAFDSDEGEQKDVQQKLRALLYGAS